MAEEPEANLGPEVEPESTEDELLEKNILIDGRFSLISLLTKNRKCRVYKGKDLLENKDVAVKVKVKKTAEKGDMKEMEKEPNDDYDDLEKEFFFYGELQGGDGIPEALFQGFAEGRSFLVLQLFGDTLLERITSKGTFTPQEARDVGLQMINILKWVHKHHFIHADIKPDNIVYAVGSETKVFLIDFGLSGQFEFPDQANTFQHMTLYTGCDFIGSLHYSSLNVHNGILPSRRDDVIGLGYILINLLSGDLPWLRPGVSLDEVRDKKTTHTIDVLCKDLPRSVLKYMKHATSLAFEEEPNYDKLSGFLNEMTETGFWSLLRFLTSLANLVVCEFLSCVFWLSLSGALLWALGNFVLLLSGTGIATSVYPMLNLFCFQETPQSSRFLIDFQTFGYLTGLHLATE